MELTNIYTPTDVFAGSDTGPYMESAIPVFSDFLHVNYKEFCAAIGHPFQVHRKLWEFAFITERLRSAGVLRPGSRGLCFGAGREQLPSLFAKLGCDVLATDAPSEIDSHGWAAAGQHASALDHLHHPQIVERDVFFRRVAFETCDMNAIPARFRGFDFCWSACCLEHLGSLRHGMDFVGNSLETLREGGYACHTTEFNLSSNDATLESEALSLYRRRDIEELAAGLRSSGHEVGEVKIALGPSFFDHHVDLPPYSPIHIKLKLSDYVSTSIGLVVRKGGSA